MELGWVQSRTRPLLWTQVPLTWRDFLLLLFFFFRWIFTAGSSPTASPRPTPPGSALSSPQVLGPRGEGSLPWAFWQGCRWAGPPQTASVSTTCFRQRLLHRFPHRQAPGRRSDPEGPTRKPKERTISSALGFPIPLQAAVPAAEGCSERLWPEQPSQPLTMTSCCPSSGISQSDWLVKRLK